MSISKLYTTEIPNANISCSPKHDLLDENGDGDKGTGIVEEGNDEKDDPSGASPSILVLIQRTVPLLHSSAHTSMLFFRFKSPNTNGNRYCTGSLRSVQGSGETPSIAKTRAPKIQKTTEAPKKTSTTGTASSNGIKLGKDTEGGGVSPLKVLYENISHSNSQPDWKYATCDGIGR
ncbi:MAG: hypothetical protein J3Q66DRAFT_343258 [Benniella sp.]|nr:MAG: hypothetical protein J3Q66DRAFT_343258 [Benniella sp.]